MLIFIAMLMVMFMITVVFSIDLAQMHLTRAQLRSATDAAAKAAAQTLSTTQSRADARNSAKNIAAQNLVAGKPMLLDDADIQFGQSLEDPATGKFVFSTSGTPINSVVVTGDRTRGSRTGSVKLFFGGLSGVTDFEPKQTATATYLERDIVLVVDRSGSMAGQKVSDLQAAIETFVVTLNETPVRENVGLASYAGDATRDVELTNDLSEIVAGLLSLQVSGATSISRGMAAGADVLTAGRSSEFVERTMIVMTDGQHNVGGEPRDEAVRLAGQNVVIHAITFGDGADQARMRDIAGIGNGKFFHASSGADLASIYREIALTLKTVITK